MIAIKTLNPIPKLLVLNICHQHLRLNTCLAASFSPYVGLGLNYTLVYDEKTTGVIAGAKLKGKDSF